MYTPTPLPAQYADLALEPGPKMLLEALKFHGLKEVPGAASSPEIMAWAKEVGAASYYPRDATPWCALAAAHFALAAGKALPPDPLAAKNWARFGVGVARPMLGDVVVFPHHVGLCVGETATSFAILGGNQGDRVSIASFLKSAAIAFRRPLYTQQPANVRTIPRNAAGPTGGKIV